MLSLPINNFIFGIRENNCVQRLLFVPAVEFLVRQTDSLWKSRTNDTLIYHYIVPYTPCIAGLKAF